MTIKLDGLESMIAYFFSQNDNLYTYKQLREFFCEVDEKELKVALDSLCEKKILLNFETIMGSTYSYLFNK